MPASLPGGGARHRAIPRRSSPIIRPYELRLATHAGIVLVFLAVWTMSPAVAQTSRTACAGTPASGGTAALSLAAETPGLVDPSRGSHKRTGGARTVRDQVHRRIPHRAAGGRGPSLSPEQRRKTIFDVKDDEWRKWMNQSFTSQV